MKNALRALLCALILSTSLAGSVSAFAQPTDTSTATVEPTEVQTQDPTSVPVETEVPPTEIPPTEIPPTDVPPTQTATIVPTEIVATELPPTEEVDDDGDEIEKDTLRAAVAIAGAIQNVTVSPENLASPTTIFR